jgi:hypothetical protein
MAKGAILSAANSVISPGGTTPRTPRCGLRPQAPVPSAGGLRARELNRTYKFQGPKFVTYGI